MASSGGVGVAPKAGRVGAAPKPLIPRSAFGIAGVQSPLPGAPPVSTRPAKGAPPIPRSALGAAQGMFTRPGGISHSGIPGAQQGAAPPKATPQQNQGASSQDQSGTGGNPYLDATYYNKVGTNTFDVNNKIGALGQEIANTNTALQSALGQLDEQQPINQLKQLYAANRQGGLYGSVEAGDQGLLARNYQEQRSGLTTNAGNKIGALQGQITGLEGGIPLYNQGQAIASTIRVGDLIAKNPALAALLGIPVPGSTPGGTAGGSSTGGTTAGPGGISHSGIVPQGTVPPVPRSAFGIAGPQTARPGPPVSTRPSKGLPPIPRSALGIAGGMFRGGKGKSSSGGSGY